MVVVWAAYLVSLEILSWMLADASGCLIGPDQNDQPINNDNQQTCPAFSVGLLILLHRADRFVEHHDKSIVASFTVVLAISTIGLWISTYKLWAAGERQFGLARSEFLSSHRPRMRLKHMWLTSETDWRLGGPFELTLDIVNVGNTTGFITWVNYESLLLMPAERLPQRPPYDEDFGANGIRISRFRVNTPLASGITVPITVCDRNLSANEVQEILLARRRLYLIGTIEYVDATGVRQTGFCRRFTFVNYPPGGHDHGRFEVECDHDYEFED